MMVISTFLTTVFAKNDTLKKTIYDLFVNVDMVGMCLQGWQSGLAIRLNSEILDTTEFIIVVIIGSVCGNVECNTHGETIWVSYIYKFDMLNHYHY